jgi:hypothetical protein
MSALHPKADIGTITGNVRFQAKTEVPADELSGPEQGITDGVRGRPNSATASSNLSSRVLDTPINGTRRAAGCWASKAHDRARDLAAPA